MTKQMEEWTMRRFGVALLLALVVALIATAASTEHTRAAVPSAPPAPGGAGQLVAAMAAPAATLDPTLNTATSSTETTLHVFDSLVTYDDHFHIVPDLATRWTVSKDGLVYTFQLAHNIKFHNGQTMTAADVVASIQRAMRIGQNSQTLQPVVASLQAQGTDTVVLRLKHRFGAILEVLATPLPQVAIMPAKDATVLHTLNPPHLIGTGPYQIGKWVPDQYLLLTRFAGYTPAEHFAATGLGGNRVAYFSSIKFEPVAQPETRLAGLQRGDFQYAEGLPPTSYQAVAANPNLRPLIISDLTYLAFWLNQRAGLPLANLSLRQALVSALNDQAVLNVTASGNPRFYKVSSSLFWPEQTLWYDPSAGQGIYNQPNPARVRALLKQAHYHGQQLTIITNHTYPYMYAEALEVARQFKAVGINAKLKVLDWPGAIAAFERGTGWDMFASGALFKPSPLDWYIIIEPNAPLAPGFQSPEMGRLLQLGAMVTDATQRQAIYRQVQHLVWTQVPILPLGLLYGLDASAANLKGYHTFFVPRFWNVW